MTATNVSKIIRRYGRFSNQITIYSNNIDPYRHFIFVLLTSNNNMQFEF